MAEENNGSVNSVPLNYPLGEFNNYPFDADAVRQELESATGEEVKDAVLRVVDRIGESFNRLQEDIRNLNSTSDNNTTPTTTDTAPDVAPTTPSSSVATDTTPKTDTQPPSSAIDTERIIQRVVDSGNTNTERILSAINERVAGPPQDLSAGSAAGSVASSAEGENPLGTTMGSTGAASAFIMTSVMAAMSMAFANPMVLLGGLIGGFFLWDSIKEPLTAYVQEKIEAAKGWIKTEISSTIASLGLDKHLASLSKAAPVIEKFDKLDFGVITSAVEMLKAVKPDELVAAVNGAVETMRKIPMDYAGMKTKFLEAVAKVLPKGLGGRKVEEEAKKSRSEFERLKKDFETQKAKMSEAPQTIPIVKNVDSAEKDRSQEAKTAAYDMAVAPPSAAAQPTIMNAETAKVVPDMLTPLNPTLASLITGSKESNAVNMFNVDKTTNYTTEKNNVSNITEKTVSNTTNVTNNENTTVNNSVQQSKVDLGGVEKALEELKSTIEEKADLNKWEFNKMKTFIQSKVVDRLDETGPSVQQSASRRERMLFTPITN